jgi:hypothetical protein
MSQAFDEFVHNLDGMTADEKWLLLELLKRQLPPANGKQPVAAFGWAKGRIHMSEDFDAPLEDFKDYME